jgi:hypothetical protein
VDVRIARFTFAIAVPLLACTGDPHATQEARSKPPAVRPPGAPVAVPADPLPPPEWAGSTTVALVTERGSAIGAVTATIDSGKLVVRYAVDAPWSIAISHLDIETDPSRIPQTTRTHIPILDRFAFHTHHAPAVTEFTYQQNITWQPGDTLFIAAQAEVRRPDDDCDDRRHRGHRDRDRHHRCRDRDDGHRRYREDHRYRPGHDDDDEVAIAWGAGTPFHPHASPTYFAFQPTVEAVVGGSGDWRLTRVAGRTTDGSNAPFDDSLYLLHAGGIAQSPLPADIQADLVDDTAPDEQVITVSQSVVSEIVASERAGALTPALQAIAEPLDPPSAPGRPREPVRMLRLFGRCSDKAITKSKTIDLGSMSIPLFSGSLGKNVDADLSLQGVTNGSVSFEMNLKERRFAIFGACIPYAVEFVNVHAAGSATVDYGATLKGTVSFSDSFEKELAKPALFDIWFFIGPVPVRIGFNLPISIGMDLSASVTGSVTYDAGQHASGAFDYTCTITRCSGSSSFQLGGSRTSNPLTGSISGRIQPSPWAEVAFRAFLYTDALVYAQVGVQPFLRGDLWGFLGNDCGDADGDGVTETVNALTFDADAEITANVAAAVFGKSPSRHQVFTTGPLHLAFFDLIGSTALSPLIQGSSTAHVGQQADYTVNMRPCWPYTDKVQHSVAWGDGALDTVSGAPPDGATASHTWLEPGIVPVTAIALSDDHGRQLGRSTTRDIQVIGDTCGDGVCSGGETCSSCPDDCGACPTVRNYTCGYALPDFGCDNGRTHADITAPDMTTAIATCHAVQPPDRPDFCYVIDRNGAAATDESECTAASASWRPGNDCCNFFGTLSCPL